MREKGIVLTSISAIAYGLVPLFTVYLMDASFDAISIGFFRFFLMGLYTFVVALLTRSSFKMDKSMWPSLLLAAIGQCATILLLNVSYEIIPVGNATSLHFMYPIFVSLILYYYYRNQFSKRQIHRRPIDDDQHCIHPENRSFDIFLQQIHGGPFPEISHTTHGPLLSPSPSLRRTAHPDSDR